MDEAQKVQTLLAPYLRGLEESSLERLRQAFQATEEEIRRLRAGLEEIILGGPAGEPPTWQWAVKVAFNTLYPPKEREVK